MVAYRVIHIIPTLLSLSSSPPPIPATPLSPVSVHDNVLTSGGACALFDSLPSDKTSHKLYDTTVPPTTLVECAFLKILSALNDDSRFIEYWWRSSWLNLDMHRDIDEHHGKSLPDVPNFGDVDVSKDDFKYPEHGHVLYCGVEGSDELMEGAGGATVLLSFPPSSSLYIVPSLPGRLLRFQGDLMHSVPRPALAYFDSDVVPGGTNHLIFTKIPNDEARRNVLLFNTWTQAPEGDWESPPPPNPDPPSLDVTVSPRDQFITHKFNSSLPPPPLDDAPDPFLLKIPLLGDRRRREGRLQRSFVLSVQDNSPSLVQAFSDNPAFVPAVFAADVLPP